jgi:anti-sigma factor RsiW
MSAERQSVTCQRARAQISLAADGQLSEFERRLLARHVARCVDCALYEMDVSALTDALRSAPLERTAFTIAVRRRRRFHPARAGLRAVAVALPLVVAVFIGQGALTSLAGSDRLPEPTRYPTSSQLNREVESILDGTPASEFPGIRGTQQSL